MDRDYGFAIQKLRAAASVLGLLFVLGLVLIFVLTASRPPGASTPARFWSDLILYSVPVALVVAWGLHYWHNRHPVDLILLGDKDRLTPVKKN
jgi:peptidoglycan/LPS O-acetylase OafA/YrhL